MRWYKEHSFVFKNSRCSESYPLFSSKKVSSIKPIEYSLLHGWETNGIGYSDHWHSVIDNMPTYQCFVVVSVQITWMRNVISSFWLGVHMSLGRISDTTFKCHKGLPRQSASSIKIMNPHQKCIKHPINYWSRNKVSPPSKKSNNLVCLCQ